jgi:hypothetical protein
MQFRNFKHPHNSEVLQNPSLSTWGNGMAKPLFECPSSYWMPRGYPVCEQWQQWQLVYLQCHCHHDEEQSPWAYICNSQQSWISSFCPRHTSCTLMRPHPHPRFWTSNKYHAQSNMWGSLTSYVLLKTLFNSFFLLYSLFSLMVT